MDVDRQRDADLVAAALAGDQGAFGRLYDGWYDRVWSVARRIVRDPEVAAEVAQDAFLSAWRNLATLESPEAFGGWLLRIARNASFNRQRKEQRSQPVDEGGMAVIESTGASPISAPSGFGVEDRARRVEDPAAVAGDAELVALVQESAAALGERDADVLDLQLRYGLSPAEIGEVMGMNRNAANQLCHRVRQRFATAVRARVLWRGGRPSCTALDEMLVAAGITAFDQDAVKLADKHADGCPRCAERRELRLQPSTMFAAVPLVVAPVLFKQQTAHALEVAGVPMDGSAFGSERASASGDQTRERGHRRPHRARRVVSLSAAVIVVLLAAVVALAGRTGDGTFDDLAVTATTETLTTIATSVPTTTPVESSTTVLVDEITVDEPSTTIPPEAEPSPPPPPPPPSISVDLTITPSERPLFFLMSDAPVLAWTVTGAAAVRVEGPVTGQVRVLSIDPVGSLRVCPGQQLDSMCEAVVPASHEYVLRAFDANGQEVARRSVTLAIKVS